MPIILLLLSASIGLCQEVLKEVIIEDQNSSPSFASEVRKDIEGTSIYTGKKVTSTQMDKLPVTSTNNFRQALSQTAGLLSSDVGTEGFSSLSYRGLGDPHETFNIHTLHNGLPASADMYGYPANYFVPPFQSIEKIEFIRGGASLLYGPHAGGALNYISRKPEASKALAGRVGLIAAEKNSINSYNEISGTKGDTSYLLNFNHRQTDGWRDVNDRQSIQYASAHLRHNIHPLHSLTLDLNHYQAAHQDPGGLAKDCGAANTRCFAQNRFATTLRHDDLEINRQHVALGWEHTPGPVKVTAKAYVSSIQRDSFRQSGTGFGKVANGSNTNIQFQEYDTQGVDLRVLRYWKLGDTEQALSVGYSGYMMNSPFLEELNTGNPNATSGTKLRQLVRDFNVNSLFAENRFAFGKLAITPGARFENMRQLVDEDTGAKRQVDRTDNVTLLGLGVVYDLSDKTDLYFNASEGYTPVAFATAVPLGSSQSISDDIEAAKVDNMEIGVRHQANSVVFDASLFQTFYSNLFGSDGTGSAQKFINTGAGMHRGIDASVQWRLSSDVNAWDKSWGDLDLYFNAMALSAEFVNGPRNGKRPQYAPDYTFRTGLIYKPQPRDKIALMATALDEHYGDDANSENFIIPGYTVVDLTFEKGFKNFELVGGINNILDKKYYARVRGTGIDPALPRNIYLGVQKQF
jgi:Fe(3+) dicitrate transport protein